MFYRSEFKRQARASLGYSYSTVVAVFFLSALIPICLGIADYYNPHNGALALMGLLVFGPLLLAVHYFYLMLCEKGKKPSIHHFFMAFNHCVKGVAAYLWMMLWLVLWSLLLVVPGIIKGLAYSQTFSILAQNPNLSPQEALKLSIKITDGYKWELFMVYFSFLGWWILVGLTFGLAACYVVPYIQATMMHIYFYLRDRAIDDGICEAADFAMVPPNPTEYDGIMEGGYHE